jgi:hypothetical protein
VALSGITAFLHTKGMTTQGLDSWAALSGLSAQEAVVIGIVLAGRPIGHERDAPTAQGSHPWYKRPSGSHGG